jgi:2-iminobutanoate/2-iminopropanoate deaminase
MLNFKYILQELINKQRISVKEDNHLYKYEVEYMKTIVNTNQAPAAIGPYSQAVKVNGFLFVSGQIPLDPITGQIVYGGIETQTYQVLNNLKAILEHEGLSFENVVKTSVFLSNMNDFSKMNKIYGEFFISQPPARACVEVSRLPRDVNVEIELVAAY